jgi:ATP-binding cassette subfamily G (WHITE) protein 2
MHFLPTMTVHETCQYYASLCLPSSTSHAEREQRIDTVLCDIGLSHATNTLVGGVLPGGLLLRGVSGGENRRLAIATGLLAGPSMMFLDEPTSGLDSFAALSVMKLMRHLAHAYSHTVVASIHQPRSAIWSMCDKVGHFAISWKSCCV